MALAARTAASSAALESSSYFSETYRPNAHGQRTPLDFLCPCCCSSQANIPSSAAFQFGPRLSALSQRHSSNERTVQCCREGITSQIGADWKESCKKPGSSSRAWTQVGKGDSGCDSRGGMLRRSAKSCGVRRRQRLVQTNAFWKATDDRDSQEELAIDVRDVKLALGSSSRDKAQILKGATLQVPRGELWMLLGPNGCGKSTLLKALTGLLEHDGGELRIAQPCSFVFQNPDHQVVMPTAGADVAFGLGRLHLTEDEVKRRVQESLEIVGMGEYSKRSVQTLSGGQKQRVAIAGALAERSRVLLLDELTTFLDEEDQVGVLEAVKNVVSTQSGVTALWVTHRLEELPFADGAAYMHDGKVVMHGSPSKIERYIGRLQKQALALR